MLTRTGKTTTNQTAAVRIVAKASSSSYNRAPRDASGNVASPGTSTPKVGMYKYKLNSVDP
jgi:hypothetical protein